MNKDVVKLAQENKRLTLSGVHNVSAKALVVSDVLKSVEVGPVIWLVDSEEEKYQVERTLSLWTDREVNVFELKQNLNNDSRVTRKNQMRIMREVSRINEADSSISVMMYHDFMNAVPDRLELDAGITDFKVGEDISLVEIFEKLIAINYNTAADAHVGPGEYFCQGNLVKISPVNSDKIYRLEVDFDQITDIQILDTTQKKVLDNVKDLRVYPILETKAGSHLYDFLPESGMVVEDELGIIDDLFKKWEKIMQGLACRHIDLKTFAEDEPTHRHLHFNSVVRYHSPQDFMTDFKQKKKIGWRFMVSSKHMDLLKPFLEENHVQFTEKFKDYEKHQELTLLIPFSDEDVLPEGFQNADLRFAFLTDKEIALVKKSRVNKKNVYLDFLTSLKPNDLVVHTDHGIARFAGLHKITVDEVTREYLRLNYAANDKLYVPIDQADKVSKYIGSEENAPKLTRLGSAEWTTVQKKVRKETEKIAKELLALYAARHAAKGHKYHNDTKDQELFESQFPYEPTPGQIKAINDVKADMEREMPMDRLVCGDVGFGKTEVAMRAAFKAVQNKKQVAFISPITILADQHYKSLTKRMDEFNIRVEMLSRFRTPAQQKEIVKKLAKGEVDIVVGTHRLLQRDIEFKNLGLVIVDEEQRFGVKQKEVLKDMRKEVDILTLTATPIPRTLNICLNKLRDITTITTPPPGRLPVITEVRKFSNVLIKEAITRELDRGGQVYFLHNRVQTINSVAAKLQEMMPGVRFLVAHGKLAPQELEKRIMQFKEGKFDVLVSSTIIENGIDLENANTLIVNRVEKFGLAQLYQLRGRVGRSKKQAYAYFLYHGQRLKLDAKKRLKAIVEASELGSGFQIAMKDLEIRGAGDILGANQHGVVQTVGVSHFMRMLNKAVEDLKTGRLSKEDEEKEVSVELPITAFIPDSYIVNTKDKISAYQKLSSADTFEYLGEIKDELNEEYGKAPIEVLNLYKVIELKILAKAAHITNVKVDNLHSRNKQLVLTMSDSMKPANIMNLLEYNSKWVISGTKLKIDIKYLGLNWFDELKICLEKLGIEREAGKKA